MATIQRVELGCFRSSTYNADKHTVRWVLHTRQRDEHGTTFETRGATFAPHVPLTDGHPSMFGGGGAVDHTVGRMLEGTARASRANLDAAFMFDQNSPKAIIAEGMVRDEMIRSGSFDFRPLKAKTRDGTVIEVGKDNVERIIDMPGNHYLRYKVLAHAMVNFPSDEGALARLAPAFGVDPERAFPNVVVDRESDELPLSFVEDLDDDQLDELAARLAVKLGQKFKIVPLPGIEPAPADDENEELDELFSEQ